MSDIFILLFMIFCHIIDDYKLQAPVLNMLKQKKYWKENSPEENYKRDYIIALSMHAMSWSFMILLPIAIQMKFNVNFLFAVLFIFNAFIHGVVDDLKANKFKLNLVQDQVIHLFQIFATFWITRFI